jgi:hypothetical protein
VTETWLLESEFHLLNSLSFHYYSNQYADMKFKPSRGRPFGGKIIFFKKSLKNCIIEFINSHICFVKFTKDSINFFILFVHLPHDDLSSNSIFEFDCNLTIIQDLLTFYFSKNFNCYISGDFNADFKRNNRFDRFLKNFVECNELMVLNNYENDFSYENGNYYSCIDHCLTYKATNVISYLSYLINDDNNKSDHKPLLTTIFYEGMLCSDNNIVNDDNTVLYKIFPNLNNDETKLKFQQQIELIYESNLILIKDKDDLNNRYNCITSSIKQAYDSLTQTLSKTKYFKLKKFWFDDELLKLKKEKLKFRRENKDDRLYNETLKEFKKKSRQIQKKNIKLMENHNYIHLDQLRKEKNKENFWRKINKMRSNNESKMEVDISNDDLFNHFLNIFGKQRENDSILKDNIPSDMNNLDNSEYDSIDIVEDDLFNALNDTKTSNVCGPDGISSFQIKNCSNSFIYDYIFKFFKDIFTHGIIPLNLNHSFIKPILKDNKKSNKDLSNLRPISISNVFSQIFERILLS